MSVYEFLAYIGGIPSHISGNYGVFSITEWKKWTTFSLYCLYVISVDSLLEKLKVTDIFRYLKVSDIGSDFIYVEDLLSFISSIKVYKLSALDKEDLVFLMPLYRKICSSVSFNTIKTKYTKLIKKFGFINFWRVFWVKTSKKKNKFIRNFRILGN